MALITCPDCGNKVSDLARACIKCGRPIKPAEPAPVVLSPKAPNTIQHAVAAPTAAPAKPPTRVMSVLIALIVGAIVLKVMVEDFNRKQEGTPGSGPVVTASAPEPQREIIVVNPSTLLAEYQRNEVSTNDKLRGKLIQLSGYVKEIGEFMGDPYLEIDTGDKWHSVRANLAPTNRAAAAKLSVNDSVIMICDHANYVVSSPALYGCYLK